MNRNDKIDEEAFREVARKHGTPQYIVTRAWWRCRENEILTYGQLIDIPNSAVQKWRNAGRKTAAMIKDAKDEFRARLQPTNFPTSPSGEGVVPNPVTGEVKKVFATEGFQVIQFRGTLTLESEGDAVAVVYLPKR